MWFPVEEGTESTHNTLHKKYQYNLNQIKHIFWNNNLTIARADKNKAIVIINKVALEQKTVEFIQENHIKPLNKDPTDLFKNKSNRHYSNAIHWLEKVNINILWI